jgi:peptidyl-prolyl cis-trans isomerase C
MMPPTKHFSRKYARILLASLWLSGCNFPGFSRATPTPAGPTPTDPPPTATLIPRAASINGEALALEFFEAEVTRFEVAQTGAGTDLATLSGYRTLVLEALIDLKLLALGAARNGHEVSPAEIERRIADIIMARGSQENFDAWLQENDYNAESLRSALVDEILAAEMVASIAESVAPSVEQVHARHILVASQVEADELRAQIAEGEDFGEIAQSYSIDASTRPAGGDLGWFPRGYLLWTAVEVAAFGLAPGEISTVIQSELGYHLIETLERGEHQLDFEARLSLQEQAVKDWLTEQRQAADIQIFITP